MITRIEVDGFKTFHKLSMNVPPFMAILGANAAGKSNLFDAIQFLRLVTQSSLTVAVQSSRGDLDDLFRRRLDGSSVDRISLAVEVLLDPTVTDPWGTSVTLTQTRLRYELEIVRRLDDDGNARLFVDHEEAVPLRRNHGELPKQWSMSKAFLDARVLDGKRTSNFLETGEDSTRGRYFQIRQDGVQGRARPAGAAEATVLSSIVSAEFKHLYALREELASWRFLQLEPQALREPGERYGEDRLLASGSNLARVLHRIQRESASEMRPDGVLADISADLASLVPGVVSVRVRENEQTRKWEIFVDAGDGYEHRADVASDGTLRVMALLAALHDPRYRGLICFEEPENGVNPFRLKRLVGYLQSLVTDPSNDLSLDTPLSQVFINSHSPVALAALQPEVCVFVDMQTLVETVDGPRGPHRERGRVSRFRQVVTARPLQETLFDAGVRPLALTEVEKYRAVATLDDEDVLDGSLA